MPGSDQNTVGSRVEVGGGMVMAASQPRDWLLEVVKKIEQYWLALDAGPPGPEGIR